MMAGTDGWQGGASDPSGTPLKPDKSLAELFSDLTSDMGRLFRQQVALARTETREELGQAARAGGMLAGGGLLAYLALMFASFALAWLLDEWMHRALAFLLIAALHGVIAAIIVAQGRARLRDVNVAPKQTANTLKEDVEWAKAQKS